MIEAKGSQRSNRGVNRSQLGLWFPPRRRRTCRHSRLTRLRKRAIIGSHCPVSRTGSRHREPRIMRAINLSHPSRAERRKDFVRSQLCAGCQCDERDYYGLLCRPWGLVAQLANRALKTLSLWERSPRARARVWRVRVEIAANIEPSPLPVGEGLIRAGTNDSCAKLMRGGS